VNFKKIIIIVLIFMITGCFQGSVEFGSSGLTNWPMFGKNFNHTSRLKTTLSVPMNLLWEFESSSAPGITPLFYKSHVLLPTLGGKIHIINENTGDDIATVKIGDGLMSVPFIENGVMYITRNSQDESLYCYDLNKMKKIWEKKLGRIEANPVVTGNYIIIGDLAGNVCGVDKLTGNVEWRIDAGSEIYSSPLAVDGKSLIITVKGKIFLFNPENGEKDWEKELHSVIFASPAYSDGRVFIGSREGTLYCVKFSTGDEIWQFNSKGAFYSAVSLDDACVYAGCNDHYIYALDQKNGTLKWKFATNAVVNTTPLVTKNLVVSGSLDHFIYALDITTGELLWKYETKGRIKSNIISDGNQIYVAYEDKYLAAFSPEKNRE